MDLSDGLVARRSVNDLILRIGNFFILLFGLYSHLLKLLGCFLCLLCEFLGFLSKFLHALAVGSFFLRLTKSSDHDFADLRSLELVAVFVDFVKSDAGDGILSKAANEGCDQHKPKSNSEDALLALAVTTTVMISAFTIPSFFFEIIFVLTVMALKIPAVLIGIEENNVEIFFFVGSHLVRKLLEGGLIIGVT